jgi:hypothetical protein
MAGALILFASLVMPFALEGTPVLATEVSAWLWLEPMLAVIGSAGLAASLLTGRGLPWAGGGLIGLGLYMLAWTITGIASPDIGISVAAAGVLMAGALMVLAGLLARSPATTDKVVLGRWPAAGAGLIGAGVLVAFASSDGEWKTLAYLSENWWGIHPWSIVAPTLAVTAWMIALSLYPSRRPQDQRGQVMALGAESFALFVTLLWSLTSSGLSPIFGWYAGILGAGLAVVGAWRSRGAEHSV